MRDATESQIPAGVCPPRKFSTWQRRTASRRPSRAMAQRRRVPPRSTTSADIGGGTPWLTDGGRRYESVAELIGGDLVGETAFAQGRGQHHGELASPLQAGALQSAAQQGQLTGGRQ